MRNFNMLPRTKGGRIAAAALAGTVSVGSLFGLYKMHHHEQVPTPAIPGLNAPAFPGQSPVELNPDPDSCTGTLTAVIKVGASKEGPVWEVEAVDGGCAPVYDPKTRRTIGALTVGSHVAGGCEFTDKPDRAHVTLLNQHSGNPGQYDPGVTGDVNVSASYESGQQSCEELHVQDLGLNAAGQPFETPSPSASPSN